MCYTKVHRVFHQGNVSQVTTFCIWCQKWSSCIKETVGWTNNLYTTSTLKYPEGMLVLTRWACFVAQSKASKYTWTNHVHVYDSLIETKWVCQRVHHHHMTSVLWRVLDLAVFCQDAFEVKIPLFNVNESSSGTH